MGVYRTTDADAARLLPAVRGRGLAVGIERYGATTYLVVGSDRDDVDSWVRSQAPKAVFVASLKELSHPLDA